MQDRVPVDNYIKEDHYEDCAVPASACSVDYYQQYEIKQGDKDDINAIT